MQPVTSTQSDRHLSKVIKIDESQIQNHLDRMVRSTVEKTLSETKSPLTKKISPS